MKQGLKRILISLGVLGLLIGGIVWIVVVARKKKGNGGGGNGRQPDSTVARAFLDAHNKYRRMQPNTPPLSWSRDLAAGAKAWGDYLVNHGCAFHHPQTSQNQDQYLNGNSWGQNLSKFYGEPGSPTAAVDGWMAECKYFNWKNPLVGTNGEETGHMTQLLWADTTEVGCAVSTCADGSRIFTCNYSPGGNIIYNGEYSLFRENVHLKKCPF